MGSRKLHRSISVDVRAARTRKRAYAHADTRTCWLGANNRILDARACMHVYNPSGMQSTGTYRRSKGRASCLICRARTYARVGRGPTETRACMCSAIDTDRSRSPVGLHIQAGVARPVGQPIDSTYLHLHVPTGGCSASRTRPIELEVGAKKVAASARRAQRAWHMQPTPCTHKPKAALEQAGASERLTRTLQPWRLHPPRVGPT